MACCCTICRAFLSKAALFCLYSAACSDANITHMHLTFSSDPCDTLHTSMLWLDCMLMI